MATSQVHILVMIEDLWLRKQILNSLLVEPTYCILHFLHVTKSDNIFRFTTKNLRDRKRPASASKAVSFLEIK